MGDKIYTDFCDACPPGTQLTPALLPSGSTTDGSPPLLLDIAVWADNKLIELEMFSLRQRVTVNDMATETMFHQLPVCFRFASGKPLTFPPAAPHAPRPIFSSEGHHIYELNIRTGTDLIQLGGVLSGTSRISFSATAADNDRVRAPTAKELAYLMSSLMTLQFDSSSRTVSIFAPGAFSSPLVLPLAGFADNMYGIAKHMNDINQHYFKHQDRRARGDSSVEEGTGGSASSSDSPSSSGPRCPAKGALHIDLSLCRRDPGLHLFATPKDRDVTVTSRSCSAFHAKWHISRNVAFYMVKVIYFELACILQEVSEATGESGSSEAAEGSAAVVSGGSDATSCGAADPSSFSSAALLLLSTARVLSSSSAPVRPQSRIPAPPPPSARHPPAPASRKRARQSVQSTSSSAKKSR